MPTNPEDWHSPLEIALQADLGEIEALRTKWYPLHPSKDWMVIVDDASGQRRGLMITQLCLIKRNILGLNTINGNSNHLGSQHLPIS